LSDYSVKGIGVSPVRPVGRALGIAIFAGASTMVLAVMSMASAPLSRADDPDDALTALMMGGTTMPTPSELWQDKTFSTRSSDSSVRSADWSPAEQFTDSRIRRK
jgi:hypothetical protein